MQQKEGDRALPLNTNKVTEAIKACIENGERLLNESYDLEFREPASSRYYLVMIAQEEFAKVFILCLVKEKIAPLSAAVLRAMNDHACKQLVGMIMDYMIMHWDELDELKAQIERDFELGERFPDDIGSAIEILFYEKIVRWERNNWIWADDPVYDKSALKVAKGQKDRRKQDALYVRIGRDGSVSSTPSVITEEETARELEKADRYYRFVQSIVNGEDRSRRVEKTLAAFKLLFDAHAAKSVG